MKPQDRRLGLVINPTAGKGRGEKVGQQVVDLLDSEGYQVLNLSGNTATLALEHVRRAMKDGLDALIVVGGDGMVHLGVQAVAGTDVPLGIVAMGTGNDFAQLIGLPVHDTQEAVSALDQALAAEDAGIIAVDAICVTGWGLSGQADGQADGQTDRQQVDGHQLDGQQTDGQQTDGQHDGQGAAVEPGLSGQVTQPDYISWGAGAISAGLDAAINARANAMVRPRGSSRYIIAALRELATYRSWPYKVTIENVRLKGMS